MSASRWAFSLLLVWHLTAMGLGALPSPTRLPEIGPARHPDDDPIAARLTPTLDSAAQTLSTVTATITNATGPLRRLATAYLNTLGLTQNWSMFWDPPRVDLYLRVRYYIAADTGLKQPIRPTRMATELVFPTVREDRVRIFTFRSTYRDKAIFEALVNANQQRDATHLAPGASSDSLPKHLAPIGRYFARRFQRYYLKAGECIARIEVWSGTARNPPRGRPLDPADWTARLAVLRAYYAGPVEQSVNDLQYSSYRATEGEADIGWALDYFEEP